MKWPTTFIVAAVIASVTVLGWNGTIDGAAVTSIYGSIVSGVLVGHYVKTINGSLGKPSSSDQKQGESL